MVGSHWDQHGRTWNVARVNQVICFHETQRRHREGIQRLGLLRSEPTVSQAFGIYVYREDSSFDHPTYAKCGGYRIRWAANDRADTWRIAYCGPLTPDPFVENAMILLRDTPPEHVTLVTGNIE